MSITGTIPVTVTQEAADHVAELGFQPQLAQMIDHARQLFSGPHEIRVELIPAYDEPARIVLEVITQDYDRAQQAERRWRDWWVETFPMEVGQHFTIFVSEERSNAR